VNPLPTYNFKEVNLSLKKDPRGVFAWQQLLPLSESTPPVSLGEGNTPLLPVTRIRQVRGAGEVFIKDESRNPTWSYKDRLVAAAITKAREMGAEVVCASSTGNHGAAAAAYAAAANIECVIFTLPTVPQAMKVLMQSYGAKVLAVENGPDRWGLMARAVQGWGWTPLSGFVDPPAGSNQFGIEGYKSIAYEIASELGRAPSAVIVPAAYGDGMVGIARGFDDLRQINMITNVPKIIATEPLGAYDDALENGFIPGRRVAGASHGSVAFSIASPIPTFQGYNTIVRTGGSACVVRDKETMTAQIDLAQSEGLYLEASSTTTVAALPSLVKRGIVNERDTVVLLGTSTGLKDTESTRKWLPDVPVIEPTLEDVARWLDS
jgi:threonine synthase